MRDKIGKRRNQSEIWEMGIGFENTVVTLEG